MRSGSVRLYTGLYRWWRFGRSGQSLPGPCFVRVCVASAAGSSSRRNCLAKGLPVSYQLNGPSFRLARRHVLKLAACASVQIAATAISVTEAFGGGRGRGGGG